MKKSFVWGILWLRSVCQEIAPLWPAFINTTSIFSSFFYWTRPWRDAVVAQVMVDGAQDVVWVWVTASTPEMERGAVLGTVEQETEKKGWRRNFCWWGCGNRVGKDKSCRWRHICLLAGSFWGTADGVNVTDCFWSSPGLYCALW